MEEYADYLVFNPSSSVEEIATVLYNLDYNVTPGKTDFIYGDTDIVTAAATIALLAALLIMASFIGG